MIDCKMKCSRFIGSVNRVTCMANFGHLQSHILSQIFKTHCCTFYGSALWYFNSEGFAKICTTWNKGVRTILKLPIRAHTYLLGPLLNQQNIHEQLYVRIIRCLYTMYHSSTMPQKVTGPSYNKHCTTHIFPYRLSASIYHR